MEWYEMYDSPYTFVALTTNTNTDAQNFEKFVEAVKAAKTHARTLRAFSITGSKGRIRALSTGWTPRCTGTTS